MQVQGADAGPIVSQHLDMRLRLASEKRPMSRPPITSIDEEAALRSLPEAERATVAAWCDTLGIARDAWHAIPDLRRIVSSVALLRAAQAVRARWADLPEHEAARRAADRLDGRDRTATGIAGATLRAVRRWRAAARELADELDDDVAA